MADIRSGNAQIHGTIAPDAVEADNPVSIGGYGSDVIPSAVTDDGDRVRAWFDTNGRFQVNLATRLDSTNDEVRAVGDVAHDIADAGNPVKIGGIANTSAPTAVAVSDRVNAWFDTNGRLHTSTTDGADAGVGATTDSEATGNGGVIAILKRLRTLLSGGLPAALVGGRLDVNIGASGITQAISGTVTSNAGTGTRIVGGAAAHGVAVSGNPVRTGGRARNASITTLSNDNTSDFITDLAGKQIILPYSIPENMRDGTSGNITGTSDTAVIAAQGAGIRLYITHIIVQNSHATVNTWVNGTTTKYSVYAAKEGGGGTFPLPSPLRLTANTAFNAACETTGSNTRVSAAGYISA
jgi:hypothetical protein